MLFRQLFDSESCTYTYLVADEATGEAALIDPVREQLERDLRICRELGLTLRYALDTHVHADHITAAGDLRERTGASTVSCVTGGADCASVHLGHGGELRIGALVLQALATPGHTDCSLSFRIADRVFTGDALLIRGCGRTDFQNGSPAQLYDSVTQVLFALPDDTQLYPGHDYTGQTVSTIGEERRHNPRLAGKTREEFIALMTNLRLAPPKKLHIAVPANRACGRIRCRKAKGPRRRELAAKEV